MSEILAAAVDGFDTLDTRLRAEQAVHGPDALTELQLHAVLAEGLAAAGFGVQREVVYPGEHAAGVRRSARARCDLVLLPEPGMQLADPAAEQALLDRAETTLFGEIADEMGENPGSVAPADACWLEVKSVAQHAYVDGVPVPNRAYAAQLVRGPAADLVKLARDPSIWAAAGVVLLFCENQAVGDHDLQCLAHRLLDADVPIGTPEIGGIAIEDRVGNAWCAVGVYPVRS
jgi:hypothetical protein